MSPPSTLQKKAITSLLLLISRSGYMQLISSTGVFLLTLFLTKSQFGLFFIVNEIIGILGYFSDVGLAASLIQKKNKPTELALRTSFTIQQIMVLTLTVVVFLLTPWIQQIYDLDQNGIYLLAALLLGFILASLKTIPSVLLERQLAFHKIVIVETVETIIFYTVAVTLAWYGWGVTSYTIAVISRGVIGTGLMYFLAPWPIGIAWEPSEIKDLFKFGIPYQANTLIAAIKDRLLNLFLGGVIGPQGMGIIGWSQTWSQKSLRFISDNVTKVTFPAFSRIQDDRERLARSIDKMLYFTGLSIFPILMGMGLLIAPTLKLIPGGAEYVTYYDKWQPALLAFYFYLFNSAWSSISLPITNTLAAVGKITTVSKLMVMWTILTWGIVAPAGYLYGYNGVAAAMATISVFSVVPIYLLLRIVPFHPIASLAPSFISTLVMGGILFYMKQLLPLNWLTIIGLVILGGLIYIITMLILSKDTLFTYLQQIVKTYRSSST